MNKIKIDIVNPLWDTLARAIAAGASIGLGGLVYLNCANRLLGAFLFSIGLFAVLTFEFDLYTGKVCKKTYLQAPIYLSVVWLGNLIGAAIMGITMVTHESTRIAAKELVSIKLDKPWYVMLIDGVICGLCIAIAVYGYKISDPLGRYLAIVVGVMTFILSGSEHIVADFFYLSAAVPVPLIDTVKFIVLVTFGNTFGGFLWASARKL